MKLTPRQSKMVNEMVAKEARSALESRDSRYVLLAKGRSAERLLEAGPDPVRVDDDIITDVVEEQMFDVAMTIASEAMEKYLRALSKVVAREMNRHNMSQVPVEPKDVMDAILDDESDSEMENATAIQSALGQYGRDIAKLAVQLFGGSNPAEDYNPGMD